MLHGHCVLCFALHADISYTVYSDNRPSGLSARAMFKEGRTMENVQMTSTVGSPPTCVTRILYVTVSLLVCEGVCACVSVCV